jgi:radical SAM protein with 4Fe4S-binding SPASM domain
MTQQPFSPPRRALWEVTRRCDLRCAHCLVEGGAKGEELSTEEALSLADQLGVLGVHSVSLTGGEPLLREDIFEIAARVRKHGMLLRFSANGHLVDEAVVKALVDLETQSFSVSLDGLKPTHDRLRMGEKASGRSSFDRVCEAIEKLRKTSILTAVRTTIFKGNIDELPELHNELKKLRVQRWVLQLAHTSGRFSDDQRCEEYEPVDPGQLPRISEFIVKNSKDPLLQPRAFNHIGYLSKQEPVLRKSGRTARNPIWRGCTCGLDVLGIEPDGGIKGCANQVDHTFVVGNIRTESLETIWNDRPRWHWLHPKPEQMTGECAGCALAKFCHAGCTTMAHASTGELFNQPYCLRRVEKKIQEPA